MEHLFIEKATGLGLSPAVFFDRFLSYVIQEFAVSIMHKIEYSAEEWSAHLHVLMQLLERQAQILMTKKDANATHDAFSSIYEKVFMSTGARNMFNQYHTPESISDIMAKCLHGGQGILYEPSCGSGRTLLALYAQHPGSKVVGEDVDLLSCKMCACNLLINGIEGEVICHDTLLQDQPKFRCYVNRGLKDPASKWYLIPHIELIA